MLRAIKVFFIWCKNKWRPLLLVATLLLFTRNEIKKVFQSIQYTDKQYITTNNPNGSLNFDAYLKATYSTPSAFMPGEKIHVDVEVDFINKNDPTNLKLAINNGMFMHFDNADFADSSEYQKNLIGDPIPNTLYWFKPGSTGAVDIKLSLYQSPNIFRGSSDLIYGLPGKFKTYVMIPKTKNITAMADVNIDGSTVDVMNKKSNDILFVIAIFNIAFLLYNEFIKKRP